MQILTGFGLRIKGFFLFIRVVSSLSLILTVSILMAQDRASRDQIKAFAKHHSELFKLQKAEAVRLAKENGWVIKKSIPGGGQMEIMAIGPNITDNVDAAIASGTNELWADSSSGLNLDGAGFLIGEWDGGRVKQLHQEFNNGSGTRVTLNDGLIDLSDHSTHVAGTLIAEGQQNQAHGMAPAALLHSYDWNDDIGEMADAYADDGLILSNHSYGKVRGWYKDEGDTWYWYGDIEISETEDYQFGFYGDLAITWDSLAYVCPYYMIVMAAGNDRGEYHSGDHFVMYNGNWIPSNATRDPDGGNDGYDCIGNRGVAKNILTIGAVADIPGGYTEPGDVSMTSFSCWGPTDDGRIKPDIVANGWYLYSSISTSNSSYDSYPGTSMASPTVCGTIAL
jgi:hypothetical protein